MEVRDAPVEEPPIFLVTAEGYYSVQNRMTFQGTVGVARDITHNLSRISSPQINQPAEKGKKYHTICANCKSIRDEDAFWIPPEVFFTKEFHEFAEIDRVVLRRVNGSAFFRGQKPQKIFNIFFCGHKLQGLGGSCSATAWGSSSFLGRLATV